MQLRLIRNVASHLELREAVGEEIEKEGFDLIFRDEFDPENYQSFRMRFRLNLTIARKSALIVDYTSYFHTDEEFTEEFKESHFVRKNAPAIAFPFIRSYVAHITLIAGYESVILPSVNFTVAKDGALSGLAL